MQCSKQQGKFSAELIHISGHNKGYTNFFLKETEILAFINTDPNKDNQH